MSMETSKWLNTQTLIGFTDKRGHAWHYRESDQGVEPNHYPGAVPMDDVLRRLFHWKTEETPLYIGDLNAPSGFRQIPDRKAIVRNDTRDVLGVFKDGYSPPDYEEWCVANVGNLLDDELGIGSAGLLRNGAQAWVQVEMPETVTTPEGVDFRPFLVACDSADGSLARTYKTGSQLVVCDNTLAAALSQKDGQKFKLRHTRYSHLKIATARDALGIVHTMADDFADEVKTLCETEVSREQWNEMLDRLVPIKTAGKSRSRTMAEKKRDSLDTLYSSDPRVAPWNGTAFGVLQAFNTYDHHIKTVRNVSRAERNFSNMLLGATEYQDQQVMKVLAEVSKG